MPNSKADLLANCPILARLVQLIARYLAERHPTFFGERPLHPFFPVKRTKVIHDNLWGTNRFSWRELAITDSPIMQRLRNIHQVGLAYPIYPSARHSRFEHSLGVMILASRIFDAILQRHGGIVHDIVRALGGRHEPRTVLKLKQELRLAALLHDAGHSLFSHASEKVYGSLNTLQAAADELSDLTGKKKGAGEVISFCIALSDPLDKLLKRVSTNLTGEVTAEDFDGDVDFVNVALLLVGRSRHPFLQFLGDIVSSGFDADKLDYLYRDAMAAGLPLRYDLDRYLYFVRLEKDWLPDGEGQLQNLYQRVATPPATRKEDPGLRFPVYETYRLRLPRKAINTIEQIVICKLMLFSYIYYHSKVRAAEGLLDRLLRRLVRIWQQNGLTDEQIALKFLDITDGFLSGPECLAGPDDFVRSDAYRLNTRLLPREVYGLSAGEATHAQGELLKNFLDALQDETQRAERKAELEEAIGAEILQRRSNLATTGQEALLVTGAWVDAPSLPKFEDVEELVVRGPGEETPGVLLTQMFPIRHWTHAYQHYRHSVRIFAFSEYYDLLADAAKAAMKQVIGIQSEEFYKAALRRRD